MLTELLRGQALLALLRQPEAVKYSPDQPRVPAGSPEGGEWSGGTGGGGAPAHPAAGGRSAVAWEDPVYLAHGYDNAPEPHYSPRQVAALGRDLRKQGRVNADNTVSVYHVTETSSLASIREHGLIPGASAAPGQDWAAGHAAYATYFHSDRANAERDVEDSGGELSIVEARIPLTNDALDRVIPDEESDEGGLQSLAHGGPIAIIGGVPAGSLRFSHTEKKSSLADASKDFTLSAPLATGLVPFNLGYNAPIEDDADEELKDRIARAFGELRDAYKAAPTTDSSIERLLTDLSDNAGSDQHQVDAWIAQYRKGKLPLSTLVAQARQAAEDRYDDYLDDIQPDARGSHHVLSAGLMFGALAGLAMLHTGSKMQVNQVGVAAATFATKAAAAEFGSTVTGKEAQAAAKGINDRLDAIKQAAADGDISDAQAAAQLQSAIHSFTWTRYQERRADEADRAGKTTESFILDPSAANCDSCITRADGSPYPIGTNPPIGSGDMDCTFYDKCDVEYGDGDDGPGDAEPESEEEGDADKVLRAFARLRKTYQKGCS